MFIKRAINILFLTGAVATFLACGLLDQTAEANKIVTETNALIVADNQQLLDASQKLQQLLGSELSSAKNIEAYKREHQAEFDNLSAQARQLEINETQIADRFRQASQYKLNEKYKQYLELKTQEFNKEAEASKLVAPLIESFTKTQDRASMVAVFNDYNAKSATLHKELTDLQMQSEQLVHDNPDLIR